MRHLIVVYARDLEGEWVEGPDRIRRLSTPFITKVNELFVGWETISDVTVRCYSGSGVMGEVMTIARGDFNARNRGVMVSRAVDLAVKGLSRSSVTRVVVEFEERHIPVCSRYEREEVV